MSITSLINNHFTYHVFLPSPESAIHLEQKLNKARQDLRGLIFHADFWFNLKGDPTLQLQLTEPVKWQILHAAYAAKRPDGTIDLGYHFRYDHLCPADQAMLFRILNSYAQYEKQQLHESQLYTAHVEKLKKTFIKICRDHPQKGQELIDALIKIEDANLHPIIHYLTQVRGRGIGHKPPVRNLMGNSERLMLSGVSFGYQEKVRHYVTTRLKNFKHIREAMRHPGPPSQDPLTVKTLELLKHLHAPHKDQYGVKTSKNHHAVKLYREALQIKAKQTSKSTPLGAEIRQFLAEFSAWRYQAVAIWEEYIDFIRCDAQVPHAALSNNPAKDVPQVLANSFEALGMEKEPRFAGHPGSLEYALYDPYNHGDHPHYLFKIGAAKVIRTPNVAIETVRDSSRKLKEAVIAPEFREYLAILAQKNKRHLYVNLMSTQKTYEESQLVEKIHALENDPGLNQAIAVVSLDKNSPFYHQTFIFAFQNHFPEFKNSFLDQMFGKKGHFYWSKHLNKESWQKQASAILDEVHKQYFAGKPKLTVAERIDFIEIAYVKMTEALIDLLQPETCNVSCRCCIDRGASALAMLYIDHLKTSKKPITARKIDKITALAYAPAILQLNRRMLPDRAGRLISVAHRLLNAST